MLENLKIRCKSCNRELEGNPSKSVSCGCPNMTTIINNNRITALDLGQVVMLNSPCTTTSRSLFSYEDMAWHEERRKRKIKKLDYEVR